MVLPGTDTAFYSVGAMSSGRKILKVNLLIYRIVRSFLTRVMFRCLGGQKKERIHSGTNAGRQVHMGQYM